jgi:hypothetical protein
MLDQPRRRRQAPDLETNNAPDLLPDDLRRRGLPEAPPDSLPPDDEAVTEEPTDGGFIPRPDGGNEQHPIHDEDQEDATPDDYEREIDRLDQAIRSRSH